MTNDRLALYGALFIAAGLALAYLPLGIVFVGGTLVTVALIRAWAETRGGQEG